MKTKTKPLIASVLALTLPVGVISAADQVKQKDQTRQQMQSSQQSQTKTQTQTQEQDQKMIYGWELMTVKERNEHREKMMSMKTEQERTAYLEEHHKLMQQRAREKGVELPEAPMTRGTGPGFGMRQGASGGSKGNK